MNLACVHCLELVLAMYYSLLLLDGCCLKRLKRVNSDLLCLGSVA